MSSFRPKLGLPGAYIFHWAKLNPTELHCILLSYAAPFGDTLLLPELCCTLWIYAAHH